MGRSCFLTEQIDLPLGDYRNIKRWNDRLMELEAFRIRGRLERVARR